MKDQWQSYLACFLPQARRIFSPFPLALSSYPSSYSSLGVFVAIGAIFPGKPLPPFDVHHISSMASLCCSSHQQHGFPVSCSWSHAWRGVLLHFSGAASSSRMLPSNAIKKTLKKKKTTSLSLLKGGLQVCLLYHFLCIPTYLFIYF